MCTELLWRNTPSPIGSGPTAFSQVRPGAYNPRQPVTGAGTETTCEAPLNAPGTGSVKLEKGGGRAPGRRRALLAATAWLAVGLTINYRLAVLLPLAAVFETILWFRRDRTLRVSTLVAGVGLLAAPFVVYAGVAVLNGLVVMSSIRQRLEAGMELTKAIIEGTMERVRPVIMTGLVPAIGFVPMALAHGTGAEVQKPLAMVVIGGLITATALTLLVLPAISRLILERTEKRRPETGDDLMPEPIPAE